MARREDMTQDAIEARRAYHRKYYAEHKDQIRMQQAAYWVRKAERDKAQAMADAERAIDNGENLD